MEKWVHALAAQNLGPRSLAGLMFHSQSFLVQFGMPGMPIVKPVGFGMPGIRLACPAWLILMFAPALYYDIRIIAKYIPGELEVTGFMPGNKSRADFNKKSYVCHNVCHGIGWQN